ncbi:GntP family permease [Bythopirellula goksoeyrii]|uniref:Low-affinity gluconate transporter n=1 Tax=Bythopirellula goksoeyrii TaxID=1400387 RepID=A0A5B9QIY4_9BACT|nr:SLC13 family permease [Bythopirellula goksoeyrii]QEG34141.1 Low-affinity gluconate transporter [Bythopirellula goksoeyrii]
MATWYPLFVLAVGLLVVIGGIVALRINAFMSLITAAITVSLMSPGDWDEKISRVAEAFGATAAGVGIVIALAAIIGKAMMDSGAADRIVRSSLALFGERQAATALMASSFTLAIPVFFDTVFYLLVPLARSMYRLTGKHYVKYLVAVASCASAHALVPPTPGPVLVASELGVDLGVMILVGFAVAMPAAIASLMFGVWIDRRVDVAPPPIGPEEEAPPEITLGELPGLLISMLPVLLPVLLIATRTIMDTFAPADALEDFRDLMSVLGNPNMALLLSAGISVITYWYYRRPSRAQRAESLEAALMSGGVIILITAAGGAFGAMLKAAQLAPAIQSLFGDSAATGYGLLFLAFSVAALIKFAQGSSTAAMIVTAGMFAALLDSASLGYHRVYVATAIGSGSLVGSWMNDSGFWIFAKMGGLSELDTLRTWTPLLALLGCVSMAMTVLLATLLPLV